MKRIAILLLCFLPTLGYAQNRAFGAYAWACAELHAYFSEHGDRWTESTETEDLSEREWVLVGEDEDFSQSFYSLESDEEDADYRD